MDSKGALDCFRIKSARRRKRLQKKHFEKKLIALDREYNQLSLKIWNLGYEALIPPVQKGWKRIFVLREDVRRSSRRAFFEELLEKINTVQYSDSKKFVVRRRKRGRKIYVSSEQKLRSFYVSEWNKLNLNEMQKFYFTETLVMNDRKELYKLFVFNEPWRFVLKVVPNMITLVRVRDSELEQRVREIRNYLVRNNLEGKLAKIKPRLSRYNWKAYEKFKFKDPLRNKPLHEVLNKYKSLE